jgi:hypothetical protein
MLMIDLFKFYILILYEYYISLIVVCLHIISIFVESRLDAISVQNAKTGKPKTDLE